MGNEKFDRSEIGERVPEGKREKAGGDVEERKEAAVKILELKREVEEEEVTKKREMELRFEREWLDLMTDPGLDDVQN